MMSCKPYYYKVLPDNYEFFVVTLTNSSPNEMLVMSIVQDITLNKEAGRKKWGLTFTYSI